MFKETKGVIFTASPSFALSELINDIRYDKLFVITDSNVRTLMQDNDFGLSEFLTCKNPEILSFQAGEESKNLSTVAELWKNLSDSGATRQSIVLNIGGGTVTDLGGFVASTFKRGIRFINVPTTLLGIVDAAVGGKTGFDFNGLKNEIGVICQPLVTIIYDGFLKTLPKRELLSGMGELVKTAMISSREGYISLLKDFVATPHLIEKSVSFKERITRQDPNEKGIRRILNFGHTAGHAFESLLLERGEEVSHGECVVHGIMVALILSHMTLGLPSVVVHEYKQNILSNYRRLPIGCKDHAPLLDKMRHDKKNYNGKVRFVLLSEIGEPDWNIVVEEPQISEALEIYCDMM